MREILMISLHKHGTPDGKGDCARGVGWRAGVSVCYPPLAFRRGFVLPMLYRLQRLNVLIYDLVSRCILPAVPLTRQPWTDANDGGNSLGGRRENWFFPL